MIKDLFKYIFIVLIIYSTQIENSISQVLELSLKEMTNESNRIFIGSVIKVNSSLDNNKQYSTYTEFNVENVIKGEINKTIVIKQFGGKIGKKQIYLEHIKYFKVGENVLVMLYPESKLGFTNPVGLNQGVWTIINQSLNIKSTKIFFQGIKLDKSFNENFEVYYGNSKVKLSAFVSLLKRIVNNQKSNE